MYPAGADAGPITTCCVLPSHLPDNAEGCEY